MSAHRLSLELALCSRKICKTILIFSLFKSSGAQAFPECFSSRAFFPRPVLVLDMYEHAYHMDYGAAAARYVDVFMEAIRWDNAVKLYDRYSRDI
jgi:superoxide dismutase